MTEFAAVGVGLLAALSFAVSFTAQQHAAAAVPASHGNGPRLFLALARSRTWWFGTAGDLLGYALQAVALAFGSVVLVQPVLVTAMIFALPLSAHWNGRRVGRADLAWAVLVVAALSVFTTAVGADKGQVTDALRPWIWPGLTVAAVCAVLAVAAWLARGAWKALAFGALAGVLYGVVAPLTELVVEHLQAAGIGGLLLSWPLYLLAVALAVGTAAQQAAFHAGSLTASLPATQVLEPVVAVALGVWALGARLDAHGAGAVTAALAGVAMAVGTAQLARSAARAEAP